MGMAHVRGLCRSIWEGHMCRSRAHLKGPWVGLCRSGAHARDRGWSV